MSVHFDLVDLRLMVRVAEANSLTKGAEASFISLPAASTRIKNLEESIGAKLFYRHSQGVTLTPVTNEERDPKGKMIAVKKQYVARNDLSVRVRDIQRVGDIAGRLIDKGVNHLQGVDYDYSEPEAKMDELRAKAVKDAERRARVYAEAAGLRLSRVLEIRPADDGAPFPRPYAMKAAAAPMADGAPPMRPGVQRISARVSMVWALSH